MKFPLAVEPFEPLELTAAECADVEQVAQELVHATIAEHEDFVARHDRVVDRHKWKLVKSRENVIVYKAKDSYDHQEPRVPKWTVHRLLAVGTIPGTLGDIMYGDVSPNEDTMKIKTSYINDELVDGRVLYTIQGPTMSDPFRFLGLKWIAKGHSAAVNAIVRVRDMIVVESMGVHDLPNGEQVGYHLIHSVELPLKCPDLEHMGIVRSRVSACILFKQASRHTVEVYIKSFLDPGGQVGEALTLNSAANGLTGCWKGLWCAENKKLAWLAREAARSRTRKGPRRSPSVTLDGAEWCCSVCAKTLSAFRKGVACEICWQQVCSKCRTARKLSRVCPRAESDGGIGSEVVQIRFVFCEPCIARSKRESSIEIARKEFVMNDHGEESIHGPGTHSPYIPRSNGPLSSVESGGSDIEIESIDEWERRRLQLSGSIRGVGPRSSSSSSDTPLMDL